MQLGMGATEMSSPSTVSLLQMLNSGSRSQIEATRERLRNPPYFLTFNFAEETMRMAALFATHPNDVMQIADQAMVYTRARAWIYTRRLPVNEDYANDFLRESLQALTHLLAKFQVQHPKRIAESLTDIGYYIGLAPRFYCVDLIGDMFELDRDQWLTWTHWRYMVKLVSFGPEILPKPALKPWFGPEESVNQPITEEYNKKFKKNAAIWRAVRNCVLSHAMHAIDERQSPSKLDRAIRPTLRQPRLGRPPKRVFDLSASLNIQEIPVD